MSSMVYIQGALRTESPSSPELVERLSSNVRGIHAVMGVDTEAGELTDAFKKHIFYGKPLDKTNIKEEIGDLFWYLAILCDEFDLSFEECMNTNIAKLKARYPEKFSNEKAVDRDLNKEREILEIPAVVEEVQGMQFGSVVGGTPPDLE